MRNAKNRLRGAFSLNSEPYTIYSMSEPTNQYLYIIGSAPLYMNANMGSRIIGKFLNFYLQYNYDILSVMYFKSMKTQELCVYRHCGN